MLMVGQAGGERREGGHAVGCDVSACRGQDGTKVRIFVGRMGRISGVIGEGSGEDQMILVCGLTWEEDGVWGGWGGCFYETTLGQTRKGG
jgi:hypothetical protein